MKNFEISVIFRRIALYMEMESGMIFKIRAYENAANSIDSLTGDIEEIYKKGGAEALREIPGIGKGIAEKIEEYLETGKIRLHEEMKRKVPVDIDALSAVEGIGPKKMLALYRKLKVKSLDDLERAAKGGKISRLAGFGRKTEENILKGIGFARKSAGCMTLGAALPVALQIEKRLASLPYVKRAVVAGSIRRRKETIGDADILVVSGDAKSAMNFFTSMPEVARVYGKGGTKSMVKLKSGLDVDLRVVPEKSFGAALNYFTGSKGHNVALRRIAISMGLKLNEYGLFKGGKFVAGKDEEEVYKALRLKYIEPEMRENAGEIEAARRGALPSIIGYHDLKGDLQVQTNWTDGSASIEKMAEAAKKRCLEYVAITDHTKGLAVTKGLDEARLARQSKEIDRLNEKPEGITILKGAEVNILKDGSLDITDKALKGLDVVGASVHSNFRMSRGEMTKRITAAMENENVDILFHPTGRQLCVRPAYELDIEAIIDAAKRTRTVLEINAFPDRLDLKDEHIRAAVTAGVKLCIDSDAHSTGHFPFLHFGIAQARRGWAEKKDIINAWPLEKMLKMMK